MTKKVNWVLDVDIRGFFDALDHGWLVQFVEHRIADRRIVRLIQKWLNAGVLEEGKRTRAEEGTPQGGSASPRLATLYLHYVFDLWVQAWRRKHATGDVSVVRFADDIVRGFQSKSDAERFWTELAERFRKFHLELHPEKTRLLEFGPHAADNWRRRGEGKPETFNFLGCTHICGTKRSNGRFTVLRQTMRKRLQAKLSEVKAELRRRVHDPIPAVGTWLRAVVGGHIRYYGVPMNQPGAPPVPIPGRLALASRALAPSSDRPRPVGPYAAASHPLAAPCSHLSSLSPASPWRHHLRQEPDAGNPLVRIRGGVISAGHSYSDRRLRGRQNSQWFGW